MSPYEQAVRTKKIKRVVGWVLAIVLCSGFFGALAYEFGIRDAVTIISCAVIVTSLISITIKWIIDP